jgi:hypothetical protein
MYFAPLSISLLISNSNLEKQPHMTQKPVLWMMRMRSAKWFQILTGAPQGWPKGEDSFLKIP